MYITRCLSARKVAGAWQGGNWRASGRLAAGGRLTACTAIMQVSAGCAGRTAWASQGGWGTSSEVSLARLVGQRAGQRGRLGRWVRICSRTARSHVPPLLLEVQGAACGLLAQTSFATTVPTTDTPAPARTGCAAVAGTGLAGGVLLLRADARIKALEASLQAAEALVRHAPHAWRQAASKRLLFAGAILHGWKCALM